MKNMSDFYAWLDSFINFEKKPHSKAFCLEVVRYYAALFANPQTAYKTAHIAGSKGKGSVAAMLSALLTAAGKKTGLYTSPHVNDFRERITHNGAFFSDAAYMEAFRTVRQQVQPHIGKPESPQPSWFELVTLTAFVLFRQEQLDWAVFETGMGGRLDATNIIEPAVVLLTPIELEHCEYLGNTIEQIAAEKAGIIKAGVPVFCSRQKEEALAVFKKRAAERNAPFFYLPDCIASLEHWLTVQGRAVNITFAADHPIGKLFARPIHTVLPLFTPVQAENAALAAAAFRYCCPEVSEAIIEQALAQAWLPARFQLLCTHPLIIIDGAHTGNSIQTCADTFFQLIAAHAPLSGQDSVTSGCAADSAVCTAGVPPAAADSAACVVGASAAPSDSAVSAAGTSSAAADFSACAAGTSSAAADPAVPVAGALSVADDPTVPVAGVFAALSDSAVCTAGVPSAAADPTTSVAGISATADSSRGTDSVPPDGSKPLLVFACAADKNPDMFAPIFLGKVSDIYITIPGSFKKGNIERTAGAFTHTFRGEPAVRIEADEDFNTVLQRAFQRSFAESRPLLITGSFYLAAEAQRIYSAAGFQDRGS